MERGIEYLQSPSKRRLDLIGGAAIAAAMAPVAAAMAVAASLDTGNVNPFFTQERVGRYRRSFDVLKFRTINPGDPNTPQLNGTFDRRATVFGRFVRSMGLDEMPQIANVLRGDMSLVGIRPLLEDELDRMQSIEPKLFDDWHEAYTSTRPGLTGPGQLRRHEYLRTTNDVYRESMRLDLAYVETASITEDLKIMALTPFDLTKATVHNVDGIKEGYSKEAIVTD